MKNKKEIFKEIVWLFVIGCFTGFILETIWYYFKHNVWINKQGLLYGPFKPVYGFGILAITGVFSQIKNKSNFKIFIYGIIIGAFYEYIISMFQEFVLGTATWNYSSFNFNINGRIYLPYCIDWGIITLLWIKFIYPKIRIIITKLPLFISIIVAILMIINLAISALAVYQYSNRVNNIKHNNKLLSIMDEIYNDDIIKKKFPKLKAIKK